MTHKFEGRSAGGITTHFEQLANRLVRQHGARIAIEDNDAGAHRLDDAFDVAFVFDQFLHFHAQTSRHDIQ